MEAVLEAVGQENGTFKLLGRPPLHPVSHPYYSQTAVRYGDYIAKVAAFSTAETLAAVGNPHVDTSQDPDAFRSAMVAFFQRQEATFGLRVQLCTDLAAMPIEEASAVWAEAQSPFRTVARLTLPVQDAFSDGRFRYSSATGASATSSSAWPSTPSTPWKRTAPWAACSGRGCRRTRKPRTTAKARTA